jgi:TPR repeat protein
MPTFDKAIAALAAAFLLCVCVVGATAAPVKYTSSQDALDQGIGAYNGGFYEIAVPALEYADKGHLFLAPYYLARIYSDNNGPLTDHTKAYELYLRMAEEHTDVDPDDDQRAPYVAKAMTQIASYLMSGLPAAGVQPNALLAAEYLREAAQFFRDEDAQFELAKLYLRGEGTDSDRNYAKHWLSVLSQRGHAGAQAFLADLLWRGKFMPADPVRAFALITVSVANASPYERVWIEDIYQNIYCGAAQSVRKQATGLVADWSTRYSRKPDMRDRSGLGILNTEANRTCRNGEPVPLVSGASAVQSLPATTPPPAAQDFVKKAGGTDLHDVGASVPAVPASPQPLPAATAPAR